MNESLHFNKEREPAHSCSGVVFINYTHLRHQGPIRIVTGGNNMAFILLRREPTHRCSGVVFINHTHLKHQGPIRIVTGGNKMAFILLRREPTHPCSGVVFINHTHLKHQGPIRIVTGGNKMAFLLLRREPTHPCSGVVFINHTHLGCQSECHTVSKCPKAKHLITCFYLSIEPKMLGSQVFLKTFTPNSPSSDTEKLSLNKCGSIKINKTYYFQSRNQ
jgi:hypothetical protein